MSLKFSCPECGNVIIVKQLGYGESAKCYSCGAQVNVPENAVTTDEPPTVPKTEPQPPSQALRNPEISATNSPAGKEPDIKFKTLLAYGRSISGLGWVVFAIGVIIVIAGLVALSQQNRYGGLMSAGGLGLIGTGISVMIGGILLVVLGQTISCFVAIETNTRATYEIMDKRLNKIK